MHGPLGYVLHKGAQLAHLHDQTGPPTLYPPRQSVGDYLRSTVEGFDPRTPGGALGLASMLIPGSKANRMLGKADLPAALSRAGVQPSSWLERPDPFMDAQYGIPPGRQGGLTKDPDSAAMFYPRSGGYSSKAIGPRRVGGIYKGGYAGEVYRVLDIKDPPGGPWSIKVETADKNAPQNFGARWHSTAWSPRKDQVVQQPPPGVGSAAGSYLTRLLAQKYDPNIHKPGGGQ